MAVRSTWLTTASSTAIGAWSLLLLVSNLLAYFPHVSEASSDSVNEISHFSDQSTVFVDFTKPEYDASIAENSMARTFVTPTEKMGIKLADPELSVRYKIVGGDPDKFFKAEERVVGDFVFLLIRTKTGNTNVLNRERRDSYRLEVKARVTRGSGSDRRRVTNGGAENGVAGSSGEAKSPTAIVNVKITDVNDFSPLFIPPARYEVEVPEDTPLHTSILQVTAEDADTGPNGEVYYYIDEKTNLFAIHPTTGVLSLTRPARYADGFLHRLTIGVRDRGPQRRFRGPKMTSTADVRVHVKQVNLHAPVMQIHHLPEVIENSLTDIYAIVTVDDSDRGVHGEIANVEIVEGNSDGHFRVRPGSHVNEYNVEVLRFLDREVVPQGYNLTLKATDRGVPPRSTFQKLTVRVMDANDHAPLFDREEYVVQITEMAPRASPVVRVAAHDTDSGANAEVVYRIVGGNENGEFYLNPKTGLISTAKPLDTEKTSLHTLTILALDQGNRGTRRQSAAKVIIEVIDANDNAPVFDISHSTRRSAGTSTENEIVVYLNETSPVGSIVTQVKATDADSGENGYVSYSISNLDPVPFVIDHFNGAVRTTKVLDYENMRREYLLRIRASDWGLPYRRQSEISLRVKLQDINDNRPQFERINCRGYVSRTAPLDTEVLTLSAIDFDSGNIISYRLVSGNEDDCFYLDRNSGILSVACDLSQSGSPAKRVLNVTATDGEHFTDTMPIELNLVHGKRTGRNDYSDVDVQCTDVGVMAKLRDLMETSKRANEAVEDENDPKHFAQMPSRFGVNVHAPQFMNVVSEISVNESLPFGAKVLTVKAIDRDLGYNGKLLFAISAGDEDSSFQIGMEDGVITIARPLDREIRDSYDLTVTCYDYGEPQKFAAHVIHVTVLDANDNSPKFEKSSYSRDIVENARNGTTLLTLVAVDPDLDVNGRVRYKLMADRGIIADDGLDTPFRVHPATGSVYLVGSLDREARDRYDLRVRAYDSGDAPLWSETSVSVRVLDVNDNAPRFSLGFYEVRIREDLPVGTVILTVTANDPDLYDGGEIRYAFVSGVFDDKFSLDEETGTIRVAAPLDYEETMVYNITVVASDRGAPQLSSKTYVLVEIVDVNENFHAPDFGTYVLEGSVAENLPVGAEVMRVRANDDDPPGINSQLVYSLRGGSGLGYFDIDSEGVITTLATLDRETQPAYWLTVFVQDRGLVPLSSYVDVYVTVTDANDNVPQTEDPIYFIQVPENSPADTEIFQITAFDRDSDSTVTFEITAGNPQHFFKIDPETGVLRTTGRILDREKQSEHELEVAVSDGEEPPYVCRVVIEVTDENDNSPKFMLQVYKVRVPASPHGHASLPVTQVLALDGDVGPNGEIEYSISSSDGRFKIHPRSGSIFSRKPLLENEEYEFMVQATDKGNPSRSDEVRVMLGVVPLPDKEKSTHPPKILQPVRQISIVESDPAGHLVALVEASDEDGDLLWFDIIGGNSGDEFMVGRDTGSVFLAKQLDWEKQREYNLTIRVSDGLFDSVAQLLILVTDTNDNRPEFTERLYEAEILESAPIGSSVLQLSAFDRDEDQRVFYSIHAAQHRSSMDAFKIDSTRGIIATSAPLDREAIHEHLLTVMVKDHGNPSLRNFARVRITVRDSNDHGPEFLETLIKGTVFESAEIGTSVIQAMAFDRDHGDNSRLSYSIVAGNIGNAFKIDRNLGTIQTAKELDRSRMPEYVLVVQASDSGSPELSAKVHVQILVGIADSAPPKFKHAEHSAEIEENRPAGSFVTSVTARSKSSLFYEIAAGNERKIFAINPSSGVVFVVGRLDYEQGNFFNLTIKAWNAMKASAVTNLLVSVLDQNDNYPQFVRPIYEGYIRESASVGSMVLTNSSTPLVVKAMDKDRGLNALLRYDMVENGPESRLFTVDPNTGAVKTKGILDFETMPVVEFRVRVADSGTPSLTADTVAIVRIHVEDVNDTPPQFLSLLYNTTLHLPTYKGVAVVQLNATDPDSDRNSLRFEIVRGNEDGIFGLDAVSGLIYVEKADAVASATHELEVSVTDGKYSGATLVKINCLLAKEAGLRFAVDRYQASIEENSTRILVVEIVTLLGLHLNEHVEFRILNPTKFFDIGLTSGAIRTRGVPFDREVQDKHEIIVEAVSHGGDAGPRVAHVVVEVSVTDVNDNRPTFLNLPYYSVMSVNSTEGDMVIQLEAVDRDSGVNGEIRYELVRGDGDIFGVEARTGRMILKRPLGSDRTSFEVVVAAYDGGKVPLHAETTVHIKVMDRLMPVFDKQFFNATVPENADPYTAVINVVAESPQGRKLIYGISRGNEYDEFGFDFNTGSIYVGDALDYELKSEYELYLRASDSFSGAYSEVPVHIKVTDVNDNPPVFSKLVYETSVSELRAVGAEILQVSATDKDEGMNGAVRYSLEDISLDSNSTTWFRVHPLTGLITLSRPLDHERMPVHRFYAVATDSGMPALSTSVTVWVKVDDVNDNPPVFERNSYAAMLLENAERGQFVTKVTAFDVDDSDVGNLRYSIIEGNNAQTFLIDKAAGVIRLKNVQKFKNSTSYVLNVSATDGVYTAYARLKIDVLSANKHEPQFTRASYDANVPENVPSGTSVLRVKAFDEDHGEYGTISYAIESDAMKERFKIDAETGEIRTRQQLDREEQDMYHIPIVATDSGAKRGYTIVHVNITDVNDNVPKFLAYKYMSSIPANATEGSMVVKVTATDADVGPGGTIEYSLYEADATRASSIFGVHAASGEIYLRKPVNGLENEVFQFFVRARDNGMPSLHSDVPVDVVIMAELDSPPTFDKKRLEYFISERDDVGTLVAQVKATSNSMVTYDLLTATSGGDKQGYILRVDQDGRIIVNQKPDREVKDSYTLTILAQTLSTPPLTAMADVTVKIMDENDNAPEFQSVPYHVTVAENLEVGGTVLRVLAHDADASAEIRYSLETAMDQKDIQPVTNVFSIDTYSGVITTLIPLDREAVSEYRLNVIASDNGSPPLSSATQVYIDVMDYNDNPPIFTEDPYLAAVNEDAAVGTVVIQLKVEDADALESPYLQFFITDGDSAGNFGIKENGEIVVRQALDRETVSHYDLGITVTDGVFVSETRVAINVIDANDNPPVCKRPRYVQSISESTPIGTYILTVAATDRDEGENAKLNYFLSGIGAESFVLDMNSGILKTGAPLDRETQGLYKLTAHVRDARSKAWECTSDIEISLTDVNDNSPVFSQLKYSATVPENLDVRTLITKVHATDADLGINKKIQYMFVGQAYGHFSIDSSSGLVTLSKSLDREQQAMYNLTIQAVDQGTPQLSAQASLVVIVLDVNDNPPEFESKYYHVSVPETSGIGMDVVKIWATSKDLGINAEVTYSIIGGNEHRKFNINPKTGSIVISDALDYERAKEYFLTVEAVDGGSPPLSNHASVNITIQDANDNAPMFSQSSYSSILAEDVNIGYHALQVVATDLDSGINAEVTYNISSGNDYGHFSINATTGIISVSRRLDREMVSSYKMRVGAFDSGYPQKGSYVDVIVEVSDVNDCPPLFSAINQTAIVQENKPIGHTVMKFMVTDADDPPNAGPYTFDIQDDESAFRIQDGVLKTAVKLSHSIKDKYVLRVRVYDNGTPPLSSETWVTVKIIQESQYPPLIMPLNVKITSYQDSFPGGQIGHVRATDQDPYDKLEYTLPENTRLFEVDHDNGTLFAYAGLDDGEYLLNITVSDGKFSAVTQAVVSVSLVTDDMLDRSLMVTLGPVKPEDFVMTYQKNFERGIRSLLNVRRRDVKILSIQPARAGRTRRSPDLDDFLEVLFAVLKTDEGYFTTDVLRKEMKTKMRMFESVLGLQVVKVEENLCNVAGGDSCISDNGKCADRIILDDDKVLPITTDVMSFVSPEHKHVKECVCKPGFGGERCEIVANKCAHDPCPSFKVCVPDATAKGYSCQCARGYTGPRCDMQASMCRGQDCYHPRRPFSFDGQGFAAYTLLRLRSVAIDLNVYLHFKTLFPAGNLMFAAGRIDYSILEIVNGFVQYRFECGSGEGLVRITSRRVDDGLWHSIKLKRSGKAAELILDETHRASGVSPGKNEIINLETHSVYFGAEVRESRIGSGNGDNDIRMGFSGCMDDIMLEHVALPTRVGLSNEAASLTRIKGIEYGCSSLRKVPGPCGSQPCLNGGSCVERPSGGGGGFACLCRERFFGKQCEIDRDPCADYPCLHGGTCTNEGNDFRCQCPAGLTGKRCDYGRFCNPNPCKNRGWCEEGISSAVCQCRGFTGSTCEVDVDECLQNPCANGATCVNTQGSFRCLCHTNTTGFYCGESIHLTNITSSRFFSTWEEIAGIGAVVLLIIIVASLFICYRRRCTKRQQQRRVTGNGGVEDRNMIPLLTKTNGQEVECIRTPKMSNVEQTQTQTAFVNNVRPASYAPSSAADGHMFNHQPPNLNNFDTVRSYGSAADELELFVPPPPDFLQNLNNQGLPQGMSMGMGMGGANGPHVGRCPPPPLSPRNGVPGIGVAGSLLGAEGVDMSMGDVRRNPKPWHVNDLDSIKGSYYDSQKIQNDLKAYDIERCKPPNKGIRVKMPELPLQKVLGPGLGGTMNDTSTPDDVPAARRRSQALPSNYQEFQQYLELLAVYPLPPPWDYHWDCSDWAKGAATPLPNITEVSGGEVPDSSSFHSNESNESNNVGGSKSSGPPPLPPPTDQDAEIETLPVAGRVVVDGSVVGSGEDHTQDDVESHGEIPFSDIDNDGSVVGVPFADVDAVSGAESCLEQDDRPVPHPDDYLPAHHLTMSENETTDSESAALWRRPRPRFSGSGAGGRRSANAANRRGFVAMSRDSFLSGNGGRAGSGGTESESENNLLPQQTSSNDDEEPGNRLCDIDDSDGDVDAEVDNGTAESTRLLGAGQRSMSPPVQITKL